MVTIFAFLLCCFCSVQHISFFHYLCAALPLMSLFYPEQLLFVLFKLMQL